MGEMQVVCQKLLPRPASEIWDVLRNFDLTWHPFVTTCTLSPSPQGAPIRHFETTDGGRLTEQQTYLSGSARTLAYKALSGIDGAESYRAEVSVSEAEAGTQVTWQADIRAQSPRLEAIAEGTRAVFDAGLDALQTAKPRATNGTFPAQTHLSYLANAAGLNAIQNGAKTPLVVFLHGIGGNADNWDEQLEMLRSIPAIALNLRGYGGSTLGESQSTIEDHCSDILALADHAKSGKLVLVGLSFGAWIATSFAMRHPDRLAGLALAGGCTGMSEASEAERRAFLAAREAPLSAGQTPADFAPSVVDIIAGPEAGEDMRGKLNTSMAAVPAETYRDALRLFTNPPERFDFSRISCPVLMMTGAHDRLAPPAEIHSVSHRIHAAGSAPHVQFEALQGAGHVCNLEAPEAFNQYLARFLAPLTAPPKDQP